MRNSMPNWVPTWPARRLRSISRREMPIGCGADCAGRRQLAGAARRAHRLSPVGARIGDGNAGNGRRRRGQGCGLCRGRVWHGGEQRYDEHRQPHETSRVAQAANSLVDGYSITAVGISLQDLLWAAVRITASLGKRLLKRPRPVINLPARNLLLVTYDHRRWRIPGRQKRSRTWIIDRIRSLRDAVEQRKLGGVRICSTCSASVVADVAKLASVQMSVTVWSVTWRRRRFCSDTSLGEAASWRRESCSAITAPPASLARGKHALRLLLVTYDHRRWRNSRQAKEITDMDH